MPPGDVLQNLDLVDVRQVLSGRLEANRVRRVVVEIDGDVLGIPRGPGAGGIERDVRGGAVHQQASGARGRDTQRKPDAQSLRATTAAVDIVDLREAARGRGIHVARAVVSAVAAFRDGAATEAGELG